MANTSNRAFKLFIAFGLMALALTEPQLALAQTTSPFMTGATALECNIRIRMDLDGEERAPKWRMATVAVR